MSLDSKALVHVGHKSNNDCLMLYLNNLNDNTIYLKVNS